LIKAEFDFIEVYWAYLGNPLSKIIGYLSDFIPFSISEIFFQFGVLSVFYLLTIYILRKNKKFVKIAYVGATMLFVMAFSQGVTDIDFVPTVFRSHPSERLEHIMVDENELSQFLNDTADTFIKVFDAKEYEVLPQKDKIESANKIVHKALEYMGYPQGREITKIKKMMGITRLLGLSYGGPAYHDVISGEVVIASRKDLPSSKYWRRICLVHEIAHAQGFTRELDAEILTWLALRLSESELDKKFAMLMLITKSRIMIEWPQVLKLEAKKITEKQKIIDRDSPILSFFKKISKKINVQNNSEKYGKIQKGAQYSNSEFLLCVGKMEKLFFK
jgi:hypothetical protein